MKLKKASDFSKKLQEQAQGSGLSKSSSDLLQRMFVPSGEDSIMTSAPERLGVQEVKNEDNGSKEKEKSFFVDEAELETETLRKRVEDLKRQMGPSGDVEKVANLSARNLVDLMVSKSLIGREKAASLVSKIAKLDNTAFNVIKELCESIKPQAKSSDVKTASVASKQPIYLAKPVIGDKNSLDSITFDAPWSLH